MRITYTIPTILLLVLSGLISGCTDKKADFITKHEKIYEIILESNYNSLAPMLNERSQKMVSKLHAGGEIDTIAQGVKEYGLETFAYTYIQSFPTAKSGDDLLTYLGLREISIFSYADPYFTIAEETQVAPSPFVAMYRTHKGKKRLTWVKYDEVAPNDYRLDLVYTLKQEEKVLLQEIENAKKGYADLNEKGFLKNYYENISPQQIQSRGRLIKNRKEVFQSGKN